MRSSFRNIGILTILVYIGLTLFIGFSLISEPDTFNLLNQKAPQIVLLVTLNMIIGLLAFLFLILGFTTKVEFVYIKDSLQSKGKDMQTQTNAEDSLSFGNAQLSDALAEIKQAISLFQNDRKKLLEMVLQKIAKAVTASIGSIYLQKTREKQKIFEMVANYAFYQTEETEKVYEFGEGLVGQVAKNNKMIYLDNVPEGYIKVVSGLGDATPTHLIILPVSNIENKVLGVLELASLEEFTQDDQNFLNEVTLMLAKEIETNQYEDIVL